MDQMPYYYRATVDRSISMLIHKQYPEVRMALNISMIFILKIVKRKCNKENHKIKNSKINIAYSACIHTKNKHSAEYQFRA